MSAGRKKQHKGPSKRRASARATTRAADPPAASVERRADGRFHLALVVDPASGRERLDLVRPVFLEEWQNRLTSAAANTAYAILREEMSVASVARLGKATMESTSTLVGGLLARTPAGSVACHAGCDHCCYQSVGVTPPEAMAIVSHLVRTWSPVERTRLRARIHAFAEEVRGMSSDERVSPRLPCPFLVDHACSIYDVRPLSCRGVNSLDAETCRKNLHDPEARAASLEGKSAGHILIAPLRAFNAISAGIQLGLAERFGLDMRPLDLVLALDLLLEDADVAAAEAEGPGLRERWLLGEPTLVSARGGDASRDPNRLELVGAVPAPEPAR